MDIRFQIKGRVFVVSFGYQTKWQGSIHFVNIIEEFYDDHYQVVDANLLKSFFRGRKYK